ncbi:MAG: hypothetical protein K0S28_2487, partial [Paucimonas sp.]|nr:hypothetical protein [Paucimonas sp.]
MLNRRLPFFWSKAATLTLVIGMLGIIVA